MGLFRKKQDPLDQRAQSLNRRIAELEAEISKLNSSLQTGQVPRSPGGPPKSANRPESAGTAPAASGGQQPPPNRSSEPIFERMPARPLEGRKPEPAGSEALNLGLKRPVWSQWWGRLKSRLVDPPPANEKLVNYLAAGGIQGLRPLRYERRVARNRIIFICVVLGLFLWGILVVFWHAR